MKLFKELREELHANYLSYVMTIVLLILTSLGLTAQIVPDQYYYLQAQHSSKYIQLAQASKENGVRFNQWDKTGETTQQFKFVPVDGGYYHLVNRFSGKSLDVAEFSSQDGGFFHQWDYWEGDNQKFKLESVGGGNYLIGVKHSNKYLDVSNVSQQNGALIHQWEKTGAGNQQFKLIAVEEGPKPGGDDLSGTYRIKLKATQKLLGANNQMISTQNQDTDEYGVFLLEKDEEGAYRIAVKGSGRYLHYDAWGDKLLSTRVQETDDFTRFYFEKMDDGSYRIKSKADNKYFHCDGLGDQLVSARYQESDDFTRFYLEAAAGDGPGPEPDYEVTFTNQTKSNSTIRIRETGDLLAYAQRKTYRASIGQKWEFEVIGAAHIQIDPIQFNGDNTSFVLEESNKPISALDQNEYQIMPEYDPNYYGYDIYYIDPLRIQTSKKEKVFQGMDLQYGRDYEVSNYSFGAGDYKKVLVPKGLTLTKLGNGEGSLTTEVSTNEADFQRSFSVNVGLSGGVDAKGGSVVGTLSTGYSEEYQKNQSGNNMYQHSRWQANHYMLSVEGEDRPLSEELIAAVKSLPQQYDYNQYKRIIIDRFGSHYAKEMIYGGFATQHFRMSGETFSEFQANGVDVGLAVEGNYGPLTGGASLDISDSKQQAYNQALKKSSTKFYWNGGGGGLTITDAAKRAIENKYEPAPIKVNLDMLSNILVATRVNGAIEADELRTKKENLRKAIIEYVGTDKNLDPTDMRPRVFKIAVDRITVKQVNDDDFILYNSIGVGFVGAEKEIEYNKHLTPIKWLWDKPRGTDKEMDTEANRLNKGEFINLEENESTVTIYPYKGVGFALRDRVFVLGANIRDWEWWDQYDEIEGLVEIPLSEFSKTQKMKFFTATGEHGSLEISYRIWEETLDF